MQLWHSRGQISIFSTIFSTHTHTHKKKEKKRKKEKRPPAGRRPARRPDFARIRPGRGSGRVRRRLHASGWPRASPARPGGASGGLFGPSRALPGPKTGPRGPGGPPGAPSRGRPIAARGINRALLGPLRAAVAARLRRRRRCRAVVRRWFCEGMMRLCCGSLPVH